MCMSNNRSPFRVHLATNNNTETASIDCKVFDRDTKHEFANVKSCLGNLSYSNEWEALLKAKLFKGTKTKYNSEEE